MGAILLDKGITGMRMERLRRASPFEMKVLHAHTFWEIYYLLEGECIYFIDGRSYALERGALVFVGTNVLHRTLAERHERILIELDPATLADFGMRLPLLEQNASIAVQLPPPQQRQVEAFFHCIAESLGGEAPGYAARVRLYLLALLSYVDEHARGAPAVPRDRSSRHRLAEAVIRYLDAHYDQDVTLEEVAQALYVSKYHLSRAFKEVTGCTLVEYLTAVRLQHARYLLASTRLHVADIASRTGFNSLSHFNRVFLRQVGMPPLQYRKALSRHGEERATGTEQGLFLP